MAGPESLEDLLVRVALRDRAAFRDLYRRTSAKLFGVCLRILSDRTDAEEVLQETYVKIWRNAKQFSRTRASATAWLSAVARNQSIDRLRSRRAPAFPIEEAFGLADDRPSPETASVATDDNRRLHDCLRTLEGNQASAIATAYFGGQTYEELARGLKVPLGTVKSWIRRGLARLKDCLER